MQCEMCCGTHRIYFISHSASTEYFTIIIDNYFTFCVSKIFHKTRGRRWRYHGGIETSGIVNGLCRKVIKLCGMIKGHYSLTNQLERSATSIGANIHEANYAHSRADFVAKLQISLKECYETEYWLELLVKAELVDCEQIKDIYNQCGTIRRILVASVNTAKNS